MYFCCSLWIKLNSLNSYDQLSYKFSLIALWALLAYFKSKTLPSSRIQIFPQPHFFFTWCTPTIDSSTAFYFLPLSLLLSPESFFKSRGGLPPL